MSAAEEPSRRRFGHPGPLISGGGGEEREEGRGKRRWIREATDLQAGAGEELAGVGGKPSPGRRLPLPSHPSFRRGVPPASRLLSRANGREEAPTAGAGVPPHLCRGFSPREEEAGGGLAIAALPPSPGPEAGSWRRPGGCLGAGRWASGAPRAGGPASDAPVCVCRPLPQALLHHGAADQRFHRGRPAAPAGSGRGERRAAQRPLGSRHRRGRPPRLQYSGAAAEGERARGAAHAAQHPPREQHGQRGVLSGPAERAGQAKTKWGGGGRAGGGAGGAGRGQTTGGRGGAGRGAGPATGRSLLQLGPHRKPGSLRAGEAPPLAGTFPPPPMCVSIHPLLSQPHTRVVQEQGNERGGHWREGQKDGKSPSLSSVVTTPLRPLSCRLKGVWASSISGGLEPRMLLLLLLLLAEPEGRARGAISVSHTTGALKAKKGVWSFCAFSPHQPRVL